MKEKLKAMFHEYRQMGAKIAEFTSPILPTLPEAINSVIHIVTRNISSPVACKAGCGYCCNMPVNTTQYEVFYIADRLRSEFAEDRITSMITRVKLALSQRSPDGTVQCPFLDANNTCLIYKMRPLACRYYLSLNVDDCIKHKQDSKQPVKIALHVRAMALGLAAGACEVLSTTGLDVRRVDLIAGILVALEQADAQDQWLLGQPVLEDAIWKFE